MKIRHLSKIVCLFLIFSFATFAQNQQTNIEDEQILFNVTVTTKKGDWITGLEAENFKIYDEKKLQQITLFSAEDNPASIGILIDKSESTKKVNNSVIQSSLTTFLNKAHPDNQYFSLSFNTIQGFLFDDFQDNKTILQSTEKQLALKPQGLTNFYDAIEASMQRLSKGKYAKKVLIILSDAIDSKSKIEFEDLRKIVKKSDVLIYSITLDTGENDSGLNRLIGLEFSVEISRWSGGNLFIPETDLELDKAFLQIAEELSSQYVIGFKMAEKDKKEKWQDVKIKVELPPYLSNIGKPVIRSRTKYYLQAKSN